jgi:hypothetical protein
MQNQAMEGEGKSYTSSRVDVQRSARFLPLEKKGSTGSHVTKRKNTSLHPHREGNGDLYGTASLSCQPMNELIMKRYCTWSHGCGIGNLWRKYKKYCNDDKFGTTTDDSPAYLSSEPATAMYTSKLKAEG